MHEAITDAPPAGVHVARVASIPWEDRVNVDNWPSQAGMYFDDRDNAFTLRLINYPKGSVEPRHVHDGSHATTVLRGKAIVDGRTLGPLDVILGPGGEPHGPIHYPDGCKLLSAFQGSYFHSEVTQLASAPRYRLIESAAIAWASDPARGCRTKLLVDHGLGRLQVEVLQFSAGGTLRFPAARTPTAILVVDGEADLRADAADASPARPDDGAPAGQAPLGEWDFIYLRPAGDPVAVGFARPATLLLLTLREDRPAH